MYQTTRIETVQLYPDNDKITLTSYIAGKSKEMPYNEKRRAILICPGGGYWGCSDREAEPIALTFLARGFNTFVLEYSVLEQGCDTVWPKPLYDASLAMKYIRDHAEDFYIDPDAVYVMGFSAGGHLACALGTLWDDEKMAKDLGYERGYNKPNGMVLAYPVITGLTKAHRGSIDAILGDEKDDEEARKRVSLELHVSEKTVPTFIWSTQTDRSVPPQNTLRFALALADNKIPFEAHVYRKGMHGGSLGNPIVGRQEAEITPWVEDCIAFLDTLKKN